MKNTSKFINKVQAHSRSGFALIATITITALLLVVGLAMSSLSTVTTKTSEVGRELDEARQNARLALMSAIGQLQSLSGQDTRITASSRLLDEDNVEVTGVWRSWEGSDHDDQDNPGKASIPDYASKRENGNLNSTPSEAASGNEGRFLGWLGSGAENVDINDLSSFSEIYKEEKIIPEWDPVPFIQLIGSGSVTDTDEHVYVKPNIITSANDNGAVAWWTSGNASKAMINVDRDEAPTSAVGLQERILSNGRADSTVFDLGEVNTRPIGTVVPSVGSLNLLDESAQVRRFHDLTTYSRGLLTNAAAGHWKRDLSIFSEQYLDLPDYEGGPNATLPAFMFTPGDVFNINKAVESSNWEDQPPHAIIYPWTNYRNLRANTGWAQIPAVCSWTSITEYARQYQHLTTSTPERTAMEPHFADYGRRERFEFQELVRRIPVIARIDWVLSLCSEQVGNSDQYKAGVMLTPVVTMWNPYNVELTTPGFIIRIRNFGLAPLEFTFGTSSGLVDPVDMPEIIGSNLDLTIQSEFTLGAGETRVFSTNQSEVSNLSDFETFRPPGGTSRIIPITPGFTTGKGFRSYRVDGGDELVIDGDEEFSLERIQYADDRDGELGIWIDMGPRLNDLLAVRMGYREEELASHTNGVPDGRFDGRDVLETLYPRLEEEISVDNISEVSNTYTTAQDGAIGLTGLNTQVFGAITFGMKFATPFRDNAEAFDEDGNPEFHSHLRTKGMLQAHPLTFYSEVGNQDLDTEHSNMIDCGVFHPVNAPYDFGFYDVNSWNDTLIPHVGPNNESYIISGVEVGNGISRCVISELLTRPIQSLAQLQHYDIRNNNPIPPFQMNLIGNSSAHPLFDPDQIEIVTETNAGLINDDSYLLNHLLFDDWFVSSIAPDLHDHSNNIERSLQTVYDDHLSSKQALPNRFYVPARGASVGTVSSGLQPDSTLYTYEVIAAELEVDGAFNVNSVSVDAWKAILRHSNGMDVPYLNSQGQTVLDSESNYPYPRTSIAGDRLTTSDSTNSTTITNGQADNEDAVKFAGVPNLTEMQIDALAEEIVSEVRKRGPFLSLSEFVNRQLSNDRELAYAGTIAKALHNLSLREGDATNPFADIQALAPEVLFEPYGDPDFGFPEAAIGSTAFGVPGWVRQADILTPLAPIITVRDDSFTIRAYGDYRNDNGDILAAVWCEAIVQRRAEFVDPADDKNVVPYDPVMSEVNNRFGRKYEIVSFRWLDEDEI